MSGLGIFISPQKTRIVGVNTDSFPYIADKYSDCLSVVSLFKGSASYSGDCIQMQRQSDGQYFEIPFDGNVIDYAALVAQAADGQTYHITTWYDSSGNGNDFTTGIAANQPKIIISGAVQFSDEKLIFSGPSDGTVTLVSASLIGLYPLDFYMSLQVTGTYQNNYAPLLGRKTGSMETFYIDPGGTSTNSGGTQDGSPTLYIDDADVTSSTTGDRYTALTTDSIATAIGVDTTAWTFSGAIGGNLSTTIKTAEFKFRGAWFFDADTSANRGAIEADITYLKTLKVT